MKNKFYLVIVSIIVIGALFSYSGGSPVGRTSSPGDGGNNCASCHSGTAVSSQDNWITSNIPDTGYTPGETYTITASGSHVGAAKFGFEVTSEVASNKVGTFAITNAGETKLTNGNAAVTHTSSGNTPTGGEKSWTFDWTAPETGTGEVTFFGAFNAANGNSGTTGDVIYTSTLIANEQVVGIKDNNSAKLSIAPNPAKETVNISSKEIILSISLFNISGKQVKRFNKINENAKRINLNNLSKGVYFMKIKTTNSINTKKLIIE